MRTLEEKINYYNNNPHSTTLSLFSSDLAKASPASIQALIRLLNESPRFVAICFKSCNLSRMAVNDLQELMKAIAKQDKLSVLDLSANALYNVPPEIWDCLNPLINNLNLELNLNSNDMRGLGEWNKDGFDKICQFIKLSHLYRSPTKT